ncbi:MAG: hypothetical protein ACRDOB_20240 [Streptosporangiaceae bacterium]
MPEPDPVSDPPCGVDPLSVGVEPAVGAVTPPVVDDVLDVPDGLAAGDDDGLGEVTVLLCFFVAEEVGVAFGALVGGALPQPVEVLVGFALGLGELVAVGLCVGVALGVPVSVGVTLDVTVGLELAVGLAGGVVVAVEGLGDGLLVVGVGDGLTFGVALGEALGVGDGEHDVMGAGTIPAPPVLVRFPAPVPKGPVDGDAEADGDGVLVSSKAAEAAEITTWRSGGTEASTTPTANTVTPMARAGRSMSSFQFMGRRGACRRAAEPARAGAGVRPDHACCQYLPSCAKNPAMASRIAVILDWLA